jgi:hypothetical protein
LVLKREPKTEQLDRATATAIAAQKIALLFICNLLHWNSVPISFIYIMLSDGKCNLQGAIDEIDGNAANLAAFSPGRIFLIKNRKNRFPG